MKSIFCTSFAAPIGYYKAFLQSDINILETHEHYIKQSIRNRCEIATSNGILILTVPLSERRNNMPVSEVRICYKSDWQRQHLKTLATAYKSSPFFEFYIDELEALYKLQPESLLEWNQIIHQQLLKWLRINKPFERTLAYQKVYENMQDYRNTSWKNLPTTTTYHQVFENKLGFVGNLSIFDLLFNCGNESQSILKY
jgi:hypothetical protein